MPRPATTPLIHTFKIDSHAIARTSSTRCFLDEPGSRGGTASPRTPQVAMSEFGGEPEDAPFLSPFFVACDDDDENDETIHNIAGGN